MNQRDPNDSWAQVELYRWQHGELPPQDNTCKELDVSEGLKAMADAIEKGCKAKDTSIMPDPYNVCSAMRYAAKLLKAPEKKNSEARRSERVGRNMSCPCGSGLKFKNCCY